MRCQLLAQRPPFTLVIGLILLTMSGCLVNPVPTPATGGTTTGNFDNAEDTGNTAGVEKKDATQQSNADSASGTDQDAFYLEDAAGADATSADVPQDVTADVAGDVTQTVDVSDDATQSGDTL